jgi:L-threonylcarbamoyladenylate synthase
MKVLEKTPSGLTQAADIIQRGGVILWPSCGVYGLACHAQDRQAVERIYSIKTRERNKPLPVIANRLTASRYGDLSDLATNLIERYWPGFLGLIVDKKPTIPDFVTTNVQSVALVCPNELVA